MLNEKQKKQNGIELKENQRILGFAAETIADDLRLGIEELEVTLNVGPNEDPTNVWRLRDYMEEKILEQGKIPHPYSILKENIYFPYIKNWQ